MKTNSHSTSNQFAPTVSHQAPDPAERAKSADRNDFDYLTVKEAAAFLRCSKSYLDKLRCAGGGPVFIRAGVRKILYRRADLSDWMRKRRFDNTSQYVEE